MTSKRKFLKIAGGGIILAAVGAGSFIATRTPTKALAPWQPTTYEDPRKSALSYALLAPNPHNRQPWLVELIGDDTVKIHRDIDRDLPETDPFHRQLYVGLGAFIETMKLAAGAQGHNVDIQLLPEGQDGPVALARFAPGANADPLAAQILHRHSNKAAYTTRKLSAIEVAVLENYATLYTDEKKVAAIREMTKRAFDIEMMTPAKLKESVDLMRIGKAEINANPDGIEMTSPFLEVLRLTGMLTEQTLMNTEHPGSKAHRREYHSMLDATPQYAVLTTAGNTREDQLRTGEKLMRLYLKATEMGIGIHPVSQALQEYQEMEVEYTLAHELLAPRGHTVQMLLRMGFGPEPVPTPRWPLESLIMYDA